MVIPAVCSKSSPFVNSIWCGLTVGFLHGTFFCRCDRWSWNVEWRSVIASYIVFWSPTVGFTFFSPCMTPCQTLESSSSCSWLLGSIVCEFWRSLLQMSLKQSFDIQPSLISCMWTSHQRRYWQEKMHTPGVCLSQHMSVGNFVPPCDEDT